MDRIAWLKAADLVGGRWDSDARRLLRQATSAGGGLSTDPENLVARALAILAEGDVRGDEIPFRPPASIVSQIARQPVDLALQRRVLTDGTECRLPIRYFDVQCLVATFLTRLDPAAELLKGSGLQAVSQEDGKGVVVLYFIEYRETDIGPYNEVGLTILARAPGDPIPANYVVNLPVTTEVASRAGREIWGYNKSVAAIEVKSGGKTFSTFLRDVENTLIGSIEGRRGASVPTPPTDILTFTLLQGRVIKTIIRVLTPFRTSGGEDFVFKIGASTDPMANNLRILGLDGARPMLLQYADPFQALLFPGDTV
jgi:hypothetical protein